MVQHQPLKTLVDGDVLRQQGLGEGLEFGPQGQGSLQIGRAQRVFFNADEMQARAGHCLLFKQLPGAEEIQPGTEAGFANHQFFAGAQGGKTFAQAVLFDKHIAGFFQARLVGEVHVIEHPRARAALVVPVELGVGQYRVHGGLSIGKAAILADQGNGN